MAYLDDDNQQVAQFQEKIDSFKRRLSALDPDQLVDSLAQYPTADLRLLLGMSVSEFKRFTNFEARYQEHLAQSSQRCKPVSLSCSPVTDLFARSERRQQVAQSGDREQVAFST